MWHDKTHAFAMLQLFNTSSKKTIQYLGIGNDNNDTEWKIPMVMVAA
jgi:hypothetical protein